MCKTRCNDDNPPPSLAHDAVANNHDHNDLLLQVVPVAAGDHDSMQRILSRDQRTTYHRLPDCPRPAEPNQQSTSQHQISPQQQQTPQQSPPLHNLGLPPRTKHPPRQYNHNHNHSAQTLQQLRTCQVHQNSCDDSATISLHHQPNKTLLLPFVAWFRLLGLLLTLSVLSSVESAPTAMTLESRRLDQTPKWLNPCGFAAEEFEGDLDVVQLNDATLLGNIVMQAKTALNYAHGFRDDFIKKTFNTDYADLHLTWKDNHYDWLPGLKQIPKMLGENLEQDYLHKLEVRMLDTALLDAYEYMQRYAVGLEQIAWDQEDYALDFRKQFKDTEYNLRSVLCELQMALAERGVSPRPDVTRDVMSLEFRDMSESATYRNLRDWLIFRDYMNGLEFVVQVFEHFIHCFESS